MHKSLFLLLFLIKSIFCYGQTDGILKTLASKDLRFFMHKDSIANLYEIKDAFVINNQDTIEFSDSALFFNISYYYPNKFQSYLFYDVESDSGLYISLNFFKDRLFRINILTTKAIYSEFIKSEIQKFSNNQDSIRNNSELLMYGELKKPFSLQFSKKPVLFYFRENQIFSTFYLEDKKFKSLMPSWCGVGWSSKTWPRLERYVSRQ